LKAVPGDVLLDEHKRLEGKTKTGLSRTVAKAAEEAATQLPPHVSNTAQLRDLAASAARIFGWDNERTGNTYNTMDISPEDLARIRALREPAS
jgi:hypothetical protein